KLAPNSAAPIQPPPKSQNHCDRPLGLALGHGSVYGAQGAYFSELFPARIRYSGLSLVQQLGPILGGGLSPLIATALLAEYGSAYWVAGYMVAMALLSAACTFGLRPLRSDN
ncbi:hypothetical protein AAFX91_41035, partial [Bradyrhizobium sp. 31Argb]